MPGCYDQCCPSTAQLCVDAQLFVPSIISDCFVSGINFSTLTPTIVEMPVVQAGQHTSNITVRFSDPVTPNQAYLDVVFNITYTVTAPTTVTIDSINSIISATGYLVTVPISSTIVIIDGACTLSELKLNEAQFTVQNTSDCFEVKLGNKVVWKGDFTDLISNLSTSDALEVTPVTTPATYTVTFAIVGPTDPLENVACVLSKSLYKFAYENIPGVGEEPQPALIGAANLCLHVRANKNVLVENEAGINSKFPDGNYSLCITMKDHNGDWDVANIIAFHVNNGVLTARWGKDMKKKYIEITANEDADIIKTKNIKVTTSGKPEDVSLNENDFVICIECVNQLSEKFVSVNGIVMPDSTLGVIGSAPYNPSTLTFNNTVTNLNAKLSNSKMYMALKYMCYVPLSPDAPPQDPYVNHCKGTLDPFAEPVAPGTNGSQKVTLKSFKMVEITNLNDHPYNNSNVSREVSICLTGEEIESLINEQCDFNDQVPLV
jgi:hypothetical protein